MSYTNYTQATGNAIKAGSEVQKGFSKLDYIQQLYDIKRERMNKLFSTLAGGYEISQQMSRIHKRNAWLKKFGEEKGVEVDTGFLGIGDPTFSKDGKQVSIYDIILGEDSDIAKLLSGWDE